MRNRKTLISLLLTILIAIGVGSIAYSSSASAAISGLNSVNNSGYSNSNALVCDTGGRCANPLLPGQTAYQNANWNPSFVAIPAYGSALFRVIKDDYAGPWDSIQGGSTGTFLNAKNLQTFFGNGAQVQVIINDPR